MKLLLAAIMIVESGGEMDAVGDGGRSLGPYQISKPYYLDAVAQMEKERMWGNLTHFFCSFLRDNYEDVACSLASEEIVKAYWRRYASESYWSLYLEEPTKSDVVQCRMTLARIHNGGPKGASKISTLNYWERVEAQIARLSKTFPETLQDH